jgi:hypothetical protein
MWDDKQNIEKKSKWRVGADIPWSDGSLTLLYGSQIKLRKIKTATELKDKYEIL